MGEWDHDDIKDAPYWQRMVANYTVLGVNENDIARFLGRSINSIRKAVDHPTIAEQIRYLRNIERAGAMNAAISVTQVRQDALELLHERVVEARELQNLRRAAIREAGTDPKAIIAANRMPKGMADKELLGAIKMVFEHHPDGKFAKNSRLLGSDSGSDKVTGDRLKQLKERGLAQGHRPIRYDPNKRLPEPIDVPAVVESAPPPPPIDTNPENPA